MQITVTGKHLDITDPIRDYANEKAGKLSKYFDQIMSIEVIADKGQNHDYEIEMIVHVEHHEHFVAKTHGEDLYAAIDQAQDKLERQLTDHKNKLKSHKR